MAVIKDYREHVARRPGRVGKATLFESERLMVGLNHLEPGVEQAVHSHEEQDKVYHVLEGSGVFTVGDEVASAGVGESIWAPAGVPHGVRNESEGSLILLVGIAPAR